MELVKYLAEMGDLRKPLAHSRLINLSDLDAEELKLFQGTWSTTEVKRRRQVVNQLVELAGDNFELNFDSIFRFCLSDTDFAVKARAIEGLAECEDYTLIDPLIALLTSDSSESVRAAAACALGKFALLAEFQKLRPRYAEKVEKALLAVFDNKGEKLEVRRRALESLAPLSQPRVKMAIKEAYGSVDAGMRVSAIFAMGKNCDPLWLPFLLKEMASPDADIRYEAAVACGELGDDRAVPYLVPLLHDPDMQVRLATVESLGEIGGSEARRALESCLRSPFAPLRVAAREALEGMEGDEDNLSIL